MSDEKNTEFDPLGWYPDANPFEHAGVHAARLFMSDNPLIKDLAEQLGGALNNLRAAGKNPDEVAKAAYWVGLISGYLAQEEYYPSKERLKAAKAYEVRCGQKLALLQRNNNDEVLKGRAVRSIAEEYALRLLIDDYLGGERALRRASLAKKVYEMLSHSSLVKHRPSLRTINENWLAELARAFPYISAPGAPRTPTKN